MLIHFDPRKQQPPRLGPQGFDGVIFCDGANEISNETWDRIEGHPGVQRAIARGALTFGDVPWEYDEPTVVEPDEVLLLPASTGGLEAASKRLEELEAIYIEKGWQAIAAIAKPLDVVKHPDGWDSSLLRIIQAEFGADVAAELEAQQS